MTSFKFYLGSIGLFIIIITFLGKEVEKNINFYTNNIINLIDKRYPMISIIVPIYNSENTLKKI